MLGIRFGATMSEMPNHHTDPRWLVYGTFKLHCTEVFQLPDLSS